MLVKPAFGESARGITVVADRRRAVAAAGHRASEALVQEVVDCRSVLRVHATGERVLGAFARPAACISGLAEPDPTERSVEITPTLRALSTAAVRALDGGLTGLDVIETSPGAYLLLEANATFAMPAHLPQLMESILEETLLACRSRFQRARQDVRSVE